MQVLILAGGLGTRLRSCVRDRPKPMALVENKPFLEYIIKELKKQNIVDIILAVGYMHEQVEKYFKNGKDFGVSIKYSVEDKSLGTGGAIKKAEHFFNDKAITVLNGDTYCNLDFNELIRFHNKKNSKFTMVVRNVQNPCRYGLVEFDIDNKITSFAEKKLEIGSGYINSGVYVINTEVISSIEKNKNISLEKEIIPAVLQKYNILCFEINKYFIDIGIPEDYKNFCRYISRRKDNDF